jgi:hypothetical protein
LSKAYLTLRVSGNPACQPHSKSPCSRCMLLLPAGTHYSATNGTLEFKSGQSRAYIKVPLLHCERWAAVASHLGTQLRLTRRWRGVLLEADYTHTMLPASCKEQFPTGAHGLFLLAPVSDPCPVPLSLPLTGTSTTNAVFKLCLTNPLGGAVLGRRTECRIIIVPGSKLQSKV